ncbi:PP2C family serine/threonine-protein phosphatase [Sphingosinicella sp. CPCC 101087]|uniref:PP2C family protein-serine/threonine phosphatase n=1 Tax=Sphingosinicella sp. CPCC 101087 TaxID=2497754 RepID=UPI00101D292D|nr:protein phosphatase 2C domain-containing protein [Sphingosinicella sp. CPCC 101087]
MEFAPFRIESWARTHEGRVRDHNEDSYCADERQGLWAVADGMGGHEGGDWASAKLVEKIAAVELPNDLEQARAVVVEAIEAANRAILAEARRRGKQMGSTVVVLLVQDQHYAILWVGDSRAYLLRDGDLVQLSRDHTQVQEMVDRGILRPEDAVNHPMGHVLSRAIGVREEMAIDQATGEVRPGDIFLLCSDGLHGYVDEKEIARLLARRSPEAASEELVEVTLANGAPDNVTVVAVWASDPTLLSFPGK